MIRTFSDNERWAAATMAEFNGDWRDFPIERLSPSTLSAVHRRMRQDRIPIKPRKRHVQTHQA